MTQDSNNVNDIMADMQAVKADDPDMMAKLNEIALKVAEAQGKKPSTQTNNLSGANVSTDPMDELGCEGCQ